MGHKDIKMTLRYAQIAPGHTSKAVNVLDKVFGTGQKLDNYGVLENVKVS